MAWYDANRNRGYNNYGIIEPGYGGGKPAVYGYSSASSESHMTSEKVVEYGSYPARLSPTEMDLYKNIHGVAENPLLGRPFSSARDRPKKGGKSSPKFGQGKGYGKYNNFSSDDSDDDDDNEDDVICENGVCYPKPKHGQDNEYKNKGNGYGHGNYTAPHQIHPKKDPYVHETYPHDPYNEKQKKGNNSFNPPSHYETQPYYESNNRPMVYSPPPPVVKTRPDSSKEVEYNTRNSPVASVGPKNSPFVSSPRKDRQGHQETIDSAEAKRRYGGRASPGPGAPAAQQYKGTIDSEEAARKYNGVFVRY